MADVSWLLVAVVFLVAMAILFIGATAYRNWVFELSPREWGFTVVLAADTGAIGTAYLDGNGMILVLGGALIVLALVWILFRWYWRRRSRRYREEA